MTLLERWDVFSKRVGMFGDFYYEIRRALAIAQAVEEFDNRWGGLEVFKRVRDRADELLKNAPDPDRSR